MSDVQAALAEIERLTETARHELGNHQDYFTDESWRDHWAWVLDVLSGDREVLERHYLDIPDLCHCLENWPCSDAARVIRRYVGQQP